MLGEVQNYWWRDSSCLEAAGNCRLEETEGRVPGRKTPHRDPEGHYPHNL